MYFLTSSCYSLSVNGVCCVGHKRSYRIKMCLWGFFSWLLVNFLLRLHVIVMYLVLCRHKKELKPCGNESCPVSFITVAEHETSGWEDSRLWFWPSAPLSCQTLKKPTCADMNHVLSLWPLHFDTDSCKSAVNERGVSSESAATNSHWFVLMQERRKQMFGLSRLSFLNISH